MIDGRPVTGPSIFFTKGTLLVIMKHDEDLACQHQLKLGSSDENWHLTGNILLVGGFKPFLFSISYMGCHPSHWLSYFSRWFKPPTRLVISPAKYGDFIGTWRYFINDAWVKGLTPSSNWASLVGDSHHLPTRCPIAKLVYTLSFPQWYPLVMSK